MTDLELCYLPATEALRRFRARELSPAELMEAVIVRAEQVEPTVNALCIRYFDEALEQAKQAERRYAGRGPEPRALEGLPVAIKDEVPIEGQPCSEGSLLLEDDIADHTAPIAERVLAAGGITHARTTTPEFSSAGFTHSRLWGVTRNPWNPGFTPGGSSGGSAAALASGTATLATGSDIGGSIRIPASFCGIVGFKPPFGRVPVDPPFNLDQYCHDGPLARTVADCALFENVIAGPHPNDVVSLRPKLELPERLDGIEGWRIALSVAPGDFPVDPEVAANTLAAAETFREAGAIVEEVEVGWRRADVTRATLVHFGAIFGSSIGVHIAEHGDLMTSYAIDLAERSAAALAGTTFYDGLELEAKIYSELGQLFERYDLFVCPTVLTRGLAAGDDYVDHGLEVGGVELDSYFDAITTPIFNIASRCPVLAVPSGFADNGVPTGIQIVGRTYDDVSVFRAGAAYERIRPWLDAPERYPTVRSAPRRASAS
jgi:aspartyl-tRNA(Asn)/glutamyl-tRNA(Gln) amidotransferase subunit A